MKILVTLATESSADKFVFPTFTIKNRAQVRYTKHCCYIKYSITAFNLVETLQTKHCDKYSHVNEAAY